VQLQQSEHLQLLFERFHFLVQIKLLDDSVFSFVLDGVTGENNGLLTESVLLLDLDRKVQRMEGRHVVAIILGSALSHLFND